MEQINSSTLAARIMNCLQTILELEPMLRNMDPDHILLSEFKKLKAFLNDMEGLSLDEEDVSRIETATESFLQELKTPAMFKRSGATSLTLQ